MNALVGEKIAITSTVPNTTRRRIYGVANADDYQLVLVDLPGFQKPMDKLTTRMQSTVDAAFEDIDVVLFVVSARDRIGAGDRFIARRVYALGKPVIVAVNKVDNLKPSHIITQMKAAAHLGDFHALHPVRAKTKDGSRTTSAATCCSRCYRKASPSSSESRRPTRRASSESRS